MHQIKVVLRLAFFCLLIHAPKLQAQQIRLFTLEEEDGSVTGKGTLFVSLSDIDKLSQKPDSVAIPDVRDTTRCFKLEGVYRKRFLARTHVAETDRVFIYDYAENILVTLPVRNLKVVACLNIYLEVSDRQHTQKDYMIGFEINKKDLAQFKNNYPANALVSVGDDNPFLQKKLSPIAWEKTDPTGTVAEKINKADTGYLNHVYPNYVKGEAYTYIWEEYQYFVREFMADNRVVGRHVLVINQKINRPVYEAQFCEREGSSPAPLNLVEGEGRTGHQWTGDLFKNQPPVIFGLQDVSFGCPYIAYLNPAAGIVGINCDNRH